MLQSRWKRPGWVLGVGVALTVAGACDVGEMVADAMVDAGTVLTDAGEVIRDGASGDAAAQDRVETLPCDIELTDRKESAAANFVIVTTRWYAELRDTSIDPDELASVQTMLCDHEAFGESNPCPEGYVCTGDEVPSALRCQSGGVAVQVEPGLARVACGYRSVSMSLTGTSPPNVGGARWASARITLVR